jgi:hypothetical protein
MLVGYRTRLYTDIAQSNLLKYMDIILFGKPGEERSGLNGRRGEKRGKENGREGRREGEEGGWEEKEDEGRKREPGG